MISNVLLADVSTGTDNQEPVPPAEARNILPPMPLHAEERENIHWTVIVNYKSPYSVDLVDWIWKPMYVWNFYELLNQNKYANEMIGKHYYEALIIQQTHMLIWILMINYKTLP